MRSTFISLCVASVAIAGCSSQLSPTSPSLNSVGGSTTGGPTTTGPAGLTCAVTVADTDRAWPVDATGSDISVPFTANGECGWTVVSDAEFLTVLSPFSGAGSGTLKVRVAANSGEKREGHVSIGLVAISVLQSAAPVSAPPETPGSGWVGGIDPPAAPAGATTYLALRSTGDDPVGLGQSFSDTSVKGQTLAGPSMLFFSGNAGGTAWTLTLLNASSGPFTPGTGTDDANMALNGGLGRAGFILSLGGRRCEGAARFVVSEAAFGSASELKRFRVAFEQRCTGATGRLTGEVAFVAP